ncbi:hypothetical protein VSS37_13425 [Candidatus Thiothrix sp. Deng01]|uniref:Uncharacterized protein n=1 Tax=Candidatus Thiothrix phosphatis TaxID=3112415 RepID=A0ABU6CYS5_9GAMM|nr:hypothetical protein [Candidatus Thiothrix sp. Deng01]MEB4591988.1 hypothetical protein [Candidatus Thiothrix sp. Deng01]
MSKAIDVIRADVPPLGETYSAGAKVQAMATGELVTLSIGFCRSDKALAIMTVDQAERLASALQYAAVNARVRRITRENKVWEVQP